MRFRILATLAVLLLSAPSALGVQRALAPTRGELAGWLAAVGIELAYLSLAFAAFADQRRQRLAARVARAAVLTAITLNVIADYAARVPEGLSGAAQFLATFDALLLALSVLESAPLATLAYTIATLLHSSAQSHTDTLTPHTQADTSQSHTVSHTPHTVPQSDTHSQADTSHTAKSYPKPEQRSQSHTPHTQADTLTAHTQADTLTPHTQADAYTAHPKADANPQRTTSYRCPHCGAALERQQQYAAALRYGHCAACRSQKKET